MQEFVALISQVGFPIAACIALYVMQIKAEAAHKQEMEKITEALNNNTLAIQQLAERMKSNE